MNFRTWQEDLEENPLKEMRSLGAHFFYQRVLFTIRWRIPDGTNRDLINQDSSFYATLEQAEDLANSILKHIRSHNPPVPNSSSPDDSIPGST